VTWAPTNNGEGLDGNPIFTLAISKTDDRKLVLATAPRYDRMHIFASNDGGRTYQPLTYNLPGNALPMSLTYDPKNENVAATKSHTSGDSIAPRAHGRTSAQDYPTCRPPTSSSTRRIRSPSTSRPTKACISPRTADTRGRNGAKACIRE